MSLGFVHTRTLRGDAARTMPSPRGMQPSMERDGPETPVPLDADMPYVRLRRWNAAMALFHAAFAVVTLSAGNVNLSIDMYRTEITFVDNTNRTDPNAPSFLLIPAYRKLGAPLPLTAVVAAFFVVTAIAHLGNATLWRAFYEQQLALCRCPTRWVEYSLSASVMITAIAVGVGVREYTLLFALELLIATTMSFGLLTEMYAVPASKDAWTTSFATRMAPHLMGYVPQVGAWLIVAAGFYDDSNVDDRAAPWFVHVILWTELAFFFSFGIVQAVQQARAPSRYWQGELMYQVLSLVSKGTLGTIVLANVLMLSSFEEAFE